MIQLRYLERIFLVSIFLSMVFLFSLNVLVREVGGTLASQLAWIEEAVRLLNIFLVFLSLGLALERGRHVGIDTLRDALPDAYKKAIRKIIDLVGCLFSLYLAYLGYELVIFVLGTDQRSPTLNIPMGWVYLAPVIGFGFLFLRYLLSMLGVIDRFPKYVDSEEESVEAGRISADENAEKDTAKRRGR